MLSHHQIILESFPHISHSQCNLYMCLFKSISPRTELSHISHVEIIFISGAAGYLKFFQPPFLSRCPATREQQRVILIACTGLNCKQGVVKLNFLSVLHYYPLIMRACGECPSVHLVSKEPETHKT